MNETRSNTRVESSASDANFLIHPLRRSRKKTTRADDSNRELEEDSLAEEEDGEDAQVVDIAGDMTLVKAINTLRSKFPSERLRESHTEVRELHNLSETNLHCRGAEVNSYSRILLLCHVIKVGDAKP